MQLYKRLDRAFLSDEVAKKLGACQDYLSRIDSSLFLLVYDAARPVNVQKKMWKALDSIPPKLRGRFVSSGRNLGMHNMGLSVDITICDAKGVPLDMGANFDDIREIAYPSNESYYLGTPVIADCRSGALKEFIDNKFIINYENPIEFLQRINELKKERPKIQLADKFKLEYNINLWKKILE